MARLTIASPEAMTAEQSEVCDEVVAGRRGRVPAPMIAWLRRPELARRAQKLGELLRYETTLGARLTELAILVCGRHWTSHHEWTAHKRLALEAGLGADAIADIAARRPPRLADEREHLVYDIATTLLQSSRIPGDLYQRGLAEFDEQGMVELVGTIGYYCLVSLTLNAFELGLPDAVAPELDDPAFNRPAAEP